MAARPSVPGWTTLTCVLLVHIQLTTQVTPPPCNLGDNLFAPVFINSEVQQTIPETLPIYSTVARLSALDNDTLCNFGNLTYSIIGDGSAATYFQIEKDTGTVSLKTSLTNTSIVDFTVRIAAQDGSSPPWISTALLYLKVTRNFERPVWSSATYATSIPETAPVLENILRVIASDRDAQPPNNEVVYELVGNAVQLYYFEIVSSTGDIRPRRPLTSDTNRRSQFDFVVIARDKGSPPLTAAFNASVIISVFRNNNAPLFIQDPYSITISQNLGSDTLISVRAVDADPSTDFNQITYSIEGPANALALFTIDGSGNIQSTNPAVINSASETNYKIYVRAEDNGSPKLYDIALVELTINRNLNPPIFILLTYEETILETRAIGDVVLRVTATDADNLSPNNEITYSAFGSGLAFFNVNSQTGDVTVVNNLVQDSNTRYQLTVQATDRGASPLSSPQPASVTINVVRNQASPVFLQTPYDTTVLRTAGANTPVVTVTATDADTRSPYNEVTYGIASMTVNRFRVNPTTGEVTLTQGIALDSQAQYGVTVFAQDGGNPRRVTYNTFTVGVDRNLNAPLLTNPSGPNFENSTTVLETIGFDYLIYDVDAFDADLSDPYRSLRFSIIGENTASTYFLINRDSGEIRLKSSLLQDTLQTLQYRVFVSVTDGGDPPRPAPSTATITVNVIRNLNTPRWVNEPYSATIDETIGANVNIVNVLAVDDDTSPFNQVTLRVIGDEKGPTYFGLANNQISVTRNLTLDTENDLRYTLRIEARDGGSPARSATALVYITVNRNLRTPVFTTQSYTVTIPETQPLAFSVVQVQATDGDRVAPYNTLRYEISGAPFSSRGRQYFMVDAVTGVVTVRQNLETDFNDTPFYRFIVDAIDGSGVRAPQPANVDIIVIRNLFPPVFITTNYTAVINNTTPQGSPVFTALATDADFPSPFNVVRYSIIGDDGSQSFFNVDPASGAVSLAQPVFSIPNTQFRVRLQAVDGSGLTDVEVLTVYIQRNLFTPVFTQTLYERVIQETVPVSTSVLNVFAQDNDQTAPYNTVQYEVNSLLSSAPGRLYFMVDRNTGAVSLRCFLESDTSYTGVYTIVVDAVDGGGLRATPPAKVEITVVRNTTLQPLNNTNSMSPRASLCCQEPLLPYWGGSSKRNCETRISQNPREQRT